MASLKTDILKRKLEKLELAISLMEEEKETYLISSLRNRASAIRNLVSEAEAGALELREFTIRRVHDCYAYATKTIMAHTPNEAMRLALKSYDFRDAEITYSGLSDKGAFIEVDETGRGDFTANPESTVYDRAQMRRSL